MANQRGTFAKRNRETKLKDRAREKAERRANRANDSGDGTKGPQIAWDQAGGVGSIADDPVPAAATGIQPTPGASSDNAAPAGGSGTSGAAGAPAPAPGPSGGNNNTSPSGRR